METDFNRLKALLTDFGVDFEEHTKGIDVDGIMNNKELFISCYESDSKIKGYGGFFTQFTFDKDGNFIEMGAYE